MDKYIKNIAMAMKKVGEFDDDQEEIIIYSLTYLVLSIISIIGIILISSLLGVFSLAIMTSLSAATLRLMSGGAHYSSPGRCAAMSSFTFPFLALVSSYFPASVTPWLINIILLFSIYIIFKYAPVENKSKPIRQEQRRFFRIGSVIVLLIWVCVSYALDYNLANAVIVGVGWQTITLTPLGLKIYDLIDRLLQKGGGIR